jgi:hypothetical protein
MGGDLYLGISSVRPPQAALTRKFLHGRKAARFLPAEIPDQHPRWAESHGKAFCARQSQQMSLGSLAKILLQAQVDLKDLPAFNPRALS